MYKYETLIPFLRKHVKFGSMIQNTLRRVLHIFPTLLAICEHHTSKNLPILPRTIHRTVFSHFRRNRSAIQQMRDPSMQTSDNRKEPNLVSKPYGLELLS